MKIYAAEIAATLQRGREDEDMSEAKWARDLDAAIGLLRELRGEGPPDPQSSAVSAERVVELERHIAKLTEQLAQESAAVTELDERNRELSVQLEAQAEDVNRTQASAVSAERVVELERQLGDAQYNAESFRERAKNASSANQTWMERVEELERQLGAVSFALRAEGADPVRAAELVREAADEALGRLHDVEQQLAVADATVRSMTDLLEREHQNVKNARTACDELLATAYVAREVPWSDVAAGMMTIARDGTPWMVERWTADVTAVVLRNGEKTFEKAPHNDETVRVLVPYVTPEQRAEKLLADELGAVRA